MLEQKMLKSLKFTKEMDLYLTKSPLFIVALTLAYTVQSTEQTHHLIFLSSRANKFKLAGTINYNGLTFSPNRTLLL
ncbi:hypothetical protein Nwat_0823 [Nitrosococcus watsonii C-113]|uniref:Uncharacterized protein n=1 Tax=Nitrosococcus watsoni (strain C-113) TaxID=105559 RepID=D8K478_NITWC|nr:hypothetical protein Nwat_0823 [Nitrosococcus watsonii C-113]